MPDLRLARFTALSFALLASLAFAQGGKGGGTKKPDEGGEGGEKPVVKLNFSGPVLKDVDPEIAKNAERSKKEADTLSKSLGVDLAAAQGPTIALRIEEPQARCVELVQVGERMLAELATDFEVDKQKDLWASKLGPFYFYCFKSKTTFGDALREYLEKRFASHQLGSQRAMLLDIGRFGFEIPSPLSAGFIDTNYENHLAHQLGETMLFYVTRYGAPFPVKGETGPPAAPDKADIDLRQEEQISWLKEGCAMYSAIRFCGSNQTYCVTNAKYVGSVAIADKNVDTAYRLVCLEMAQGDEKSKDFATLNRTETNALDYLDLAKAWSFYDWMMRPEMRPKLIATLKGMRSASFTASLKKHAGMSLADLEEGWKKFAISEYGAKKKSATDPKKDPKAPAKPTTPAKKDPKSKP